MLWSVSCYNLILPKTENVFSQYNIEHIGILAHGIINYFHRNTDLNLQFHSEGWTHFYPMMSHKSSFCLQCPIREKHFVAHRIFFCICHQSKDVPSHPVLSYPVRLLPFGQYRRDIWAEVLHVRLNTMSQMQSPMANVLYWLRWHIDCNLIAIVIFPWQW